MDILEGVKCPRCGGNITINSRAYGCGNWRDKDGACKLTLWKDFLGHSWTLDEARTVLSGNETGLIKFVSRNTGQEFEAYASFDPNKGERGGIALRFENSRENNKKAAESPAPAPEAKTIQGITIPDGIGFELPDDDIPFV